MGYIELKAGQVALRGKINPFQPPTGWIKAYLPTSPNGWKAITFGNGKFVVVGDCNITYSTNGIVWEDLYYSLSTHPPFRCVTYGGGKFVAIAESDYDNSLKRAVSRTAYSTDGVNWTFGEMPFAGDWRGVTYGDGKFVAVCRSRQDGKGTPNGAYSTDGITWTEMSAGSSGDDLESVAYGNGRFVTVGYIAGNNGDRTGYYSTDGINWNTMTLPYVPISKQYTDITFGNGKFVAVTTEKSYCAYSTDGVNWKHISMPSSQSWYAATYGDDKFVMVADNGHGEDENAVCAYSTDGITWTEMSMLRADSWRDVAYGNGKFVAISLGGAAYWYGKV